MCQPRETECVGRSIGTEYRSTPQWDTYSSLLNGVDVLQGVAACIGVQTALKQAGLNKVVDSCATGYDQSILSQPAADAAMQGTYSTAAINVLGNPLAPPVKVFLNNLKKYTTWPGGIPGQERDYAYESVDLMIKGLQLAGPNPTRKKVISQLRNVKSWTAEGLIPAPGEDFQHFGTLAGVPKKHANRFLNSRASNTSQLLVARRYVATWYPHQPLVSASKVCSPLISWS